MIRFWFLWHFGHYFFKPIRASCNRAWISGILVLAAIGLRMGAQFAKSDWNFEVPAIAFRGCTRASILAMV